MTRIEDPTGTFPYRMWFGEKEIDEIMEIHLAGYLALESRSTFPPTPIEPFLETHVPRLIGRELTFEPYADVEQEEGSGVLGITHFFPDRVEIKIDRRLTEQADRSLDLVGRYRMTVAHETAHCLLHSQLFKEPTKDGPSPYKMTSRGALERPPTRSDSCWWEVQANRGAAALLMPRRAFRGHFVRERDAYDIHENEILQQDFHLFNAVVGYLSSTFEVSRQAVLIRLSELGVIPYRQQQRGEQPQSGGGFRRVGGFLGDFFRD